jgi:uncharacterized protein (DUF302 family)
MAPNTNTGIQCKRSNRSVDETVKRLERTLQAKGVTVFAIVDHSGLMGSLLIIGSQVLRTLR